MGEISEEAIRRAAPLLRAMCEAQLEREREAEHEDAA
jgi:hypothetical protein